MRTLQLTEWESKKIELSRAELAQLISARDLIEVSPSGPDGEFSLRPKSFVGTVVLPNLRLLIRPKAGLRNLFYLMGFRPELVKWDQELFDFEEDPDLFKAICWMLEHQLGRFLPQGLSRGYLHVQESLATLRGRLDISNQIRQRQSRAYPIACEFGEFTEDVPLNRALKSAVQEALRKADLEPALSMRLLYALKSFTSVSTWESRHPPDVHFSRLNVHWQPAFRLARLILRRSSLRDQIGNVVGSAFILDMNKLFEKFLERIIAEEASKLGYDLSAQAPRKLSPRIPIKPDFVLSKRGIDRAVADAKYKMPADVENLSTDFYQMLAYCTSLGLKSGLLIYAGSHKHERHSVPGAGIDLDLVGVDLSAEPSDIEKQTREIAITLLMDDHRFDLMRTHSERLLAK